MTEQGEFKMRTLNVEEIESVSGGQDSHEPYKTPDGRTGTRTIHTPGGGDPFVTSISNEQFGASGMGSWGDYLAANHGIGQTAQDGEEYNPNEWTPEDLEHAREIMENPENHEHGDVLWAQDVVDAADLPNEVWEAIDEVHDVIADALVPGHTVLSVLVDGHP